MGLTGVLLITSIACREDLWLGSVYIPTTVSHTDRTQTSVYREMQNAIAPRTLQCRYIIARNYKGMLGVTAIYSASGRAPVAHCTFCTNYFKKSLLLKPLLQRMYSDTSTSESIEHFRDLVDLGRGIVLRQWIMPQLHHPAPIAQHDVDHPQVEIGLWRAYKKQESM